MSCAGRWSVISVISDMTRSRVSLKAKLFRGLADPSRLGVLEALRGGPLSVGRIVTQTGLTQPNVSMHLACLAECGLVTRARRGRFVEYRIADRRIVKLLDQVDGLLTEVGGFIAGCMRYGPPWRRGGIRRRRRSAA